MRPKRREQTLATDAIGRAASAPRPTVPRTGAVMTAQGTGASLSPAIGGWIAQDVGYSATFLLLGAFAVGSVAVWLGLAPVLREAGGIISTAARAASTPLERAA